jgi:isoleucyl-tRNA synthetase
LKKNYNKAFKERLSKLSREEAMTYLQDKRLTVDGVEIQEGWLSITRNFNDKYAKHSELGVASNLETSVILFTTLDENLKKMGFAREIVNAVQKLRKNAGVNIDD